MLRTLLCLGHDCAEDSDVFGTAALRTPPAVVAGGDKGRL